MTASGSPPARAAWSSRLVFTLAAIGAAVGLGNIWRFPYLTGSSGGSAFVLVYIGAVCFVAVPILIAEIMLGRRGRNHPAAAVRSKPEDPAIRVLAGITRRSQRASDHADAVRSARTDAEAGRVERRRDRERLREDRRAVELRADRDREVDHMEKIKPNAVPILPASRL